MVGLNLTAVDAEANAQTGRLDGWVEELGVRRPWRRRGVGYGLLVAGALALRGAGVTAAMLGVDGESLTGANRLYERAGFRPVLESRRYLQPLCPPA